MRTVLVFQYRCGCRSARTWAYRLVTGAEILRTLPVLGEGIHWTSTMRSDQFVAFLRDRDTSVPLTADGQFAAHASVAIFDSLAEARAWGEEICAQYSRTRCDIYDSEGLANDSVESIYNAEVRGNYVGPKPARRRLYGGLAAVCAGIVLIVWDVHRDLLFMWGYILGIKMVLSGGAVAIQGALMLRDLR
jgi:hypothetical protein